MNEATHIKPLTALRFFAAMWVVLYHYWPKLAVAGTPAIVERGYLGVELFFVLSGFILCHVYLTALEEKRFSYGRFLWARIARIYPLHIATLVGVGVLALGATAAGFAIDQNILSWRSLPANIFMVHAWGLSPDAGWNHPSWSISAEWFAYLTFPVFGFAALLLKNRPMIALAAAGALLTGLYLVFPMFAGHDLTQATIAWGALRIVPCFALGCASWLVWNHLKTPNARFALTLGGLSLAGILMMASTGGHDAPLVLAFAALIVALGALTRAGSRFGTGRIGVYLGEVSYAVYMVCVPWKLLFANAAEKLTGAEQMPLWLWAVFLVSVIPVAAIAHHLVERPARRILRGWINPAGAAKPAYA